MEYRTGDAQMCVYICIYAKLAAKNKNDRKISIPSDKPKIVYLKCPQTN